MIQATWSLFSGPMVWNISDVETILPSVETISLRTLAITAVAPVAWGSTYFVTEHLLPPDRPLFAAVVRALPAGLVLLAVRRSLPRGSWWWRSAALGLLTIGAFFPLVFLAGYHLPGGLAATMTATSPLVVMGVARVALSERAGMTRVVAGVVGLGGVALLVLRNPGGVSQVGVLAAAGAVVVSAMGFVLVKRWPAPAEPSFDLVTLVSWQLVWGGLALLPFALVVEGGPPRIDAPALAGFLWLGVVGTALAYVCWFHGLSRMPAGSVAVVGLLNPVVGVVLGVLLAGEAFGWVQALGLALVLGGVGAGQLSPASRRPFAGTARPRPRTAPVCPVAGTSSSPARP